MLEVCACALALFYKGGHGPNFLIDASGMMKRFLTTLTWEISWPAQVSFWVAAATYKYSW